MARTSKFRSLVTKVFWRIGPMGLFFGFVGFLVGGSFGIATAGFGIPATIPFALFGYFFGDWLSRLIGIGKARGGEK